MTGTAEKDHGDNRKQRNNLEVKHSIDCTQPAQFHQVPSRLALRGPTTADSRSILPRIDDGLQTMELVVR